MNESKDLINVDSLRNDSTLGKYKGRGYSVVILDTGINNISSYFGNRVVYQYDYAYNDRTTDDKDSHGTNAAGIAASNNGVAPEANIIVLKALGRVVIIYSPACATVANMV